MKYSVSLCFIIAIFLANVEVILRFMNLIKNIVLHSPAHKVGLQQGDTLVSINGHDVEDVLDYMFYAAESSVVLEVERCGKRFLVDIKKNEYDDIGIDFETFLMDKQRSCFNKCVFCFIDQMPPNMRSTLYFKDDDARLSFLQGNYVTLTNLTQKDVDRIIKMRLAINVSVHTTNPSLRCMMMGNKFAGEKLLFLNQLAGTGGVPVNCQIVACPGLNDGEELERTLCDLCKLENIQSVAVVPVGLTRYRENLYPLRGFTREEASRVIEQISRFQEQMLIERGTRLIFASDEFFQLAKKPLPDNSYYEDYPQYENGVGILRTMLDDFGYELSQHISDGSGLEASPAKVVSIACGVAAFETISHCVEKLCEQFPEVSVHIYPITNIFFGESITVTGLLTGQDIAAQLKGKTLGNSLLISSIMLKSDSYSDNNYGDGLFLDDWTVSRLSAELGISVRVIGREAVHLVEELLS